jgi:hypothetical protein
MLATSWWLPHAGIHDPVVVYSCHVFHCLVITCWLPFFIARYFLPWVAHHVHISPIGYHMIYHVLNCIICTLTNCLLTRATNRVLLTVFFLPRAGYHEVFIRFITAAGFYLLTATSSWTRAFHSMIPSLTAWVMLHTMLFFLYGISCSIHSMSVLIRCIPHVGLKLPYSNWRIHVLYSTCSILRVVFHVPYSTCCIPRAVLHVPYARPLLQAPFSACCIPRVIFHVLYWIPPDTGLKYNACICGSGPILRSTAKVAKVQCWMKKMKGHVSLAQLRSSCEKKTSS